ncbi:hypothetical protein [Janthinobacterium sp. 17J80-10]|uniref:hypothetical protein n=1 Tax=Janthinobacterium sp. 17J80-10 TaxID=2497863 RepID=UPI0010055E16|nr:hypothetical protein [Janthinobacterium sp. 17J80-10]QAU35526.1 hypothetical protein EKL02_15900 [Janthinobacterium sp. 17J80-10]
MVSPVKKRHVYYLSGFDPRGPSYYRRLYANEGARQAAVNGMSLDIGPRQRPSSLSSQWQIQAGIDSHEVTTTYEFLRWDDLIRKYWERNELKILFDYCRVYAMCIANGMFGHVLKTAWPPFVAAVVPLLLMLASLLLAIGAGWLAGGALLAAGAPAWLALATGVATGAGVVQLGRTLEKRMNSFWLLRIYAFTRRQANEHLTDLEDRLDGFARQLAAKARAADTDEILLVGHSTGTIMAVSVLARALQIDPALASHGPRISFMTLGQCIPILSFLPKARRFRAELAAVAGAADIDWIDFTAPTDGACFAFVDPVAATGIRDNSQGNAVRQAAPRPKILSARYPTLFTPQTYAAMKRDWYRHHFQYLMAGELAGDYDFFAITAGALPLGERYRNHAPVTNFTGLKVFK